MTGDNAILVRADGSGWNAPEVRAYENEAHLQGLIAEEPGWIPGVDGDSFTAQELYTAAGPIDVCVVGRDGSITVVECKLASNSERRRMVVGQIIDYAAAIWVDRTDGFFNAWRSRTGQDLRELLEPAALLELENNIVDGRIDLCLSVDAIDSDLRRLVEYLNKATQPDVRVTALQLAYARQGDVEILIPSTFGGEIAEAKVRDSVRGSDRWTRETFLEALASDDRIVGERILDLVEGLESRGNHPPVWYGQSPGGGLYLHLHGLRFPPAWIGLNRRGELTVCGTWKMYSAIAHDEGYAQLAALLGQSHLEAAKGVSVSSLDFDQLWQALLECAMSINSPSESPGSALGP